MCIYFKVMIQVLNFLPPSYTFVGGNAKMLRDLKVKRFENKNHFQGKMYSKCGQDLMIVVFLVYIVCGGSW